jgi:hypothetical protein
MANELVLWGYQELRAKLNDIELELNIYKNEELCQCLMAQKERIEKEIERRIKGKEI